MNQELKDITDSLYNLQAAQRYINEVQAHINKAIFNHELGELDEEYAERAFAAIRIAARHIEDLHYVFIKKAKEIADQLNEDE